MGVVCGGLKGVQCAKSQYCNFPFDTTMYCGATDGTGICTAIPDACTDESNPVCGCDGKTYGNPCSAAAAGISVGYLSEIERNLSRVPIAVLKSLCDVFGIHMNWFFREGKLGPTEERHIVVRANNRPRLSFPGLGITEELLSPNLTGQLELLISTIAPGADSDNYSHEGSEAGLVLDGTLELWIDDVHLTLTTGDSFAFASTRQHRCANPGHTPTRVLWVITPPHY
jgi:quercetin dioxygenase-like cupin family protein